MDTMPHNDPRERILSAAMDAIVERGMIGLRVDDVGKRVGMSRGHVLYYFGSKQLLLIETLRWSEDRLAERRARELPPLATAREQLERFIDIYLPRGADHAEWLLWLEVWAVTAEARETADVTGLLFGRWVDDLTAIVEHGIARGEFAATDPRRFAEEFLSVLDGLSLHVLHYVPALDRERAAVIAFGVAAFQLEIDVEDTESQQR